MSPNKLLSLCSAMLAFFFFGTGRANQAVGKSSSIAVSKVMLRNSPSFLAKPAFPLMYGTTVEILEQQGDWLLVKYQENSAWIHQSALLGKNSVLPKRDREGESGNSMYDSEVVTASKGFSAEYEDLLKAENDDLNYAEVDRLERMRINEAKLLDFSRAVGLQSDFLK